MEVSLPVTAKDRGEWISTFLKLLHKVLEVGIDGPADLAELQQTNLPK
jgi:hypothetical protein